MSKLTAAQRNSLPDSAFADPKNRAYPMEDENHRKAAQMLAPKFGTPKQKLEVRQKAAKFSSIGKSN